MGFLNKVLGKNKKRFLLIGLDGVPYTLIKRLAKKGVIPSIAKLIGRGEDYFKQMDVSIPEISSVSWASFMTGTNPARHGIYGFTDLKPDSYGICFPGYPDLKEDTIWDKLGKKGKKSVVLNLPGTYPAREHNGIMVSGFVAIDLKRAVYPQTLYEKLKAMDYRIDVDTAKAMDKDYFYDDLFQTLTVRDKVFSELWKEECDLFVAVITDTDRLQHFEWDAIEDESHPRHPKTIEFYTKVDKSVNELLEFLGDDGDFMIMSDHGFCAIEEEVYLNRILKENGFLDWEKDPPESMGSLSSNTKAFAMDPSRIYIHTKDRFPKGKVTAGDYEKTRRELKDFFLELTRNGKKVIKEVFFKEEIYDGPFIDKAPDMVLLSNYGFDLKGNIKSPVQFGKTHFSGMHTRDDAFLISNKKIVKARPHIEDISGLIIENVLGY
jgi:predicted AlkP superfamily phosphohydrolase/phosphomutase